MATARVPLRPPLRPGAANYRHSRSSLYIVHTPTLEPMMDEETEEEDEPDPSTPDREREPSSTEDATPAFQIAPSPSTGGVGLFAIRPVSQGTIIFSERPLFTQPSGSRRTNSTVMAALAERTRDEQRQFFTLWNAYKAPRPGRLVLLPALGIFETNALPCGVALPPYGDRAIEVETAEKTRKDARVGVFLQASRFNHSCRPNVSRYWDSDTQEMVFRAIRDVQAGDELCLSYIDVDVLATRAQRVAGIEPAFRFTCVCEACTLKGEEAQVSDRRRTSLKRLYEEIGKCGKEPTLGLRKVKIALRLLREEQLAHFEASFCFDAFQFCVLVSDFANAKIWVRKAWECSCITTGPDSSAARMFKMYWANPRAHQLAGLLPRMTLSGPE